MTEYLVTWEIFVEAGTPEEAARAALEAQRSADSDAICFEVLDETGRRKRVVCSGPEPVAILAQALPVRRHLRLVKTSHG